MEVIYNFSAGPAMLPAEVMAYAKDEFLNYDNTGMSIMEMSHRSDLFMEIAEESEASLRQLLFIPQHYKVLFLQGGVVSTLGSVCSGSWVSGDCLW